MFIDIKDNSKDINIGDLVKSSNGRLYFVVNDGSYNYLISVKEFKVTSDSYKTVSELVERYDLRLIAKHKDIKITV